ncbi:MAB_1171c family putative transporter [Streptomyces sp. NPDC093094]|uniref:MAB_1171c family putative transporter n=1 Tax=Streptomyces sp. NPDC093094 TaxID=3366026 RepID=UPI0037FF5A57
MQLAYAVPTVLLMAGLALKSPTIVRSWRDPNARATWLVLLFASAVFLSVSPASIHRINTVTGVANFAAPWAYSLLTLFCAACLNMIITWREEPTAARRRRIRLVWAIYLAAVVGLWGTFLMADVPVERVYDLDTYYAGTPWMREHIVLYLLGYLVSTLVSAWMIWTWLDRVHARWLKAGLVFLQAGYAFGIGFDISKLLAVGARWAGRDWDFLSTRVAPPFALLGATLVATGFILPVLGPFLQTWPREQATYWLLGPLKNAIRRVTPSAAKARVSRFAPLDLRLVRRQQQIHDGLLRLAPFFDHALYERVYRVAAAEHGETTARGVAGVIALHGAMTAYTDGTPRAGGTHPPQIGREVTDHLTAIAGALYRRRLVESVRRRATTESLSSHA